MRTHKTVCDASVVLFAVAAELKDHEKVRITNLGQTYGYQVEGWRPLKKEDLGA